MSKQAFRAALKKAINDINFREQLTNDPNTALASYKLAKAERDALLITLDELERPVEVGALPELPDYTIKERMLAGYKTSAPSYVELFNEAEREAEGLPDGLVFITRNSILAIHDYALELFALYGGAAVGPKNPSKFKLPDEAAVDPRNPTKSNLPDETTSTPKDKSETQTPDGTTTVPENPVDSETPIGPNKER